MWNRVCPITAATASLESVGAGLSRNSATAGPKRIEASTMAEAAATNRKTPSGTSQPARPRRRLGLLVGVIGTSCVRPLAGCFYHDAVFRAAGANLTPALLPAPNL